MICIEAEHRRVVLVIISSSVVADSGTTSDPVQVSTFVREHSECGHSVSYDDGLEGVGL